ncbi:MAG TPA: hypothetical protein VGP07_08035 [Polyangia bacterium]|jgi:hypothetical protein
MPDAPVSASRSLTPHQYTSLGVFFLYCALLAMTWPALFWSARLGLRVEPGHVQGFVGYFHNADDGYVVVPLEGDRGLFLEANEPPATISPGTLIEKRRGQLAFRFDGEPGEWPLQPSHVALALGGLLAFGALSILVARSPFGVGGLRALAWLGAPGQVALLVLPGVGTLLVGTSVAFARGALDHVTAAATLGTVAVAGFAWNQGTWRRVRERLVLLRARRLAARDGVVADVRGTVRRVGRDMVELALDGGGTAQADVTVCERLGLGALPHAPLAVGDHIEVIGAPTEIVDQTGEHLAREGALARRLLPLGRRPLLIVAAR